MQIAVKGLFGPKLKELETYEMMADVSDEEKAEWMKVKWMAFGAIGKLHRQIHPYLAQTSGRIQNFATRFRKAFCEGTCDGQ